MFKSLPSLAVLGILAAAGFIAWRAHQAASANAMGRDVGGALVRGAAGVVEGIGGAMGIPVTDAAACRQAIDEGDMWTASFACPAKDFLAAGWNKVNTSIDTATPGLPNLSDWISDGTQPPAFTGGATGGW